MYVLQRESDGQYVRYRLAKREYTTRLSQAWQFDTLKCANYEKLPCEVARPLSQAVLANQQVIGEDN